MTTSTTRQKKARLHLVVAIAVALGCGSATLGGMLSTLTVQTAGGAGSLV